MSPFRLNSYWQNDTVNPDGKGDQLIRVHFKDWNKIPRIASIFDAGCCIAGKIPRLLQRELATALQVPVSAYDRITGTIEGYKSWFYGKEMRPTYNGLPVDARVVTVNPP